MNHDETSQSGMMRIAAWFLLSAVLAAVAFATPFSLETADISVEDSVGVSYSGDATPVGPDFVPFVLGTPSIDHGEVATGLNLTDHERPQLVHFRRALLRYAPKQSPPHSA